LSSRLAVGKRLKRSPFTEAMWLDALATGATKQCWSERNENHEDIMKF
jgi:hypothetical protein